MVRTRLRVVSILAAILALEGVAVAADEVAKPPEVPRGFFQKFLAPTMTSRLNGEIGAAVELTDPAANPWVRDALTVDRIERGAIHAATSALRQYAIQELRLDAWSIPIFGAHGPALGALQDESGGARLRFGISRLTPRADVAIPSAYGRVVFGADVRGRLATSFESRAASFSVGVSFDPSEHSGTFSLSRRF